MLPSNYGWGMFAALVEPETARIVAELGGVFVLLGIIARVAVKLHIASAPLFLLAGVGFGVGGVADLDFSQPFIGVAAEVGAIMLLLFLGLEFSAKTIVYEVRLHRKTAVVDLFLNATPGAVIAMLLGWNVVFIVAMAGITYVSSSGIATQVAREMGWKSRPEWKSLVTILVLEDLVMAPYLPVLAAIGGAASFLSGAFGVGSGLFVVAVLLFVGARGGKPFAFLLKADSGASLLLTTFGLALFAGGVAAMFDFSSAVAAFFVGLLITGELAEAIRIRMAPLRDVFAAVFFVFFGLQTDPADVVAKLPIAIILVLITWATKVATVYYALGQSGVTATHRRFCAFRGGSVLSARGEFSVAIAALVIGFAGSPVGLQGIVASYVLLSALVGPFVARFFDRKPPVGIEKPVIY
jgi:CPA2 family monovalent cation:H+ antiporter-2